MYKIKIYGLYETITKTFKKESDAYDYGTNYICNKDWSASFEVTKIKVGA